MRYEIQPLTHGETLIKLTHILAYLKIFFQTQTETGQASFLKEMYYSEQNFFIIFKNPKLGNFKR